MEEHLKDPIVGSGQSLEVPGKAVLLMIGGSGRFKLVEGCFAVMQAQSFSNVLWEKPIWEGVWLYLDPWESVRCEQSPCIGIVPGKHGPRGELLLSSGEEGADDLWVSRSYSGPASQPK